MQNLSQQEPLLKGPIRRQKYTSAPALLETAPQEPDVKLTKHMTLFDAIGIIIANVIGSGIFLSPVGVLQNMGSVGSTLVMWAVMGIFCLVQALCYTELASVIPKTGGDYTYIHQILGELPAFVAVWGQIFLVVATSNAAIALTASVYLWQPFGIDCNGSIVSCTAIVIICLYAVLNCRSTKLGTRMGIVFSTSKLIALVFIIITGAGYMFFGHTENFISPWENSSTSPGQVALGAVNAYFAYKGWEGVNNLPEEMLNPQRDLPIAVVVALLTITAVYTLTNIAYFSALSPTALLQSPAVALSFIEAVLGAPSGVLISIAVAMSCMGTINGSMISDTRYLFAAGRNHQVPRLCSMIHIQNLTPIIAILVMAAVSICYSLVPSIQLLTNYSSLAVQLKILLCMTAYFWFRWKEPNLHRPMKMNVHIAAVVYIFMVALIGFSVYADPINLGIGLALFLAGIPIYYATKYLKSKNKIIKLMNRVTMNVQLLTLVVPETNLETDSEDEIVKPPYHLLKK